MALPAIIRQGPIQEVAVLDKNIRIAVNRNTQQITFLSDYPGLAGTLIVKDGELKLMRIFGTPRGGAVWYVEPSAPQLELWKEFFGVIPA